MESNQKAVHKTTVSQRRFVFIGNELNAKRLLETLELADGKVSPETMVRVMHV
jgi:hypothetical protein